MYYLTWFSNDTGEWVVEAVDEEVGVRCVSRHFLDLEQKHAQRNMSHGRKVFRLIRRPPKEASCIQREGWVVF
jgi:hypothetical protein